MDLSSCVASRFRRRVGRPNHDRLPVCFASLSAVESITWQLAGSGQLRSLKIAQHATRLGDRKPSGNSWSSPKSHQTVRMRELVSTKPTLHPFRPDRRRLFSVIPSTLQRRWLQVAIESIRSENGATFAAGKGRIGVCLLRITSQGPGRPAIGYRQSRRSPRLPACSHWMS